MAGPSFFSNVKLAAQHLSYFHDPEMTSTHVDDRVAATTTEWERVRPSQVIINDNHLACQVSSLKTNEGAS